MFLSRILILPALAATLAFGATGTAWADDDEARDEELHHLADDLLEVIERAHHNAALLDHAFFESMDIFDHDDYVHLAFYKALPAINWYRNHDARQWVSHNQSHYFHDFIEANQVTVAVVVMSGDDYISSMVGERVGASLPQHAIFTGDPNYSDIVISLRLGDMVPQFSERSRKPKSKKYKKAYLNIHGWAGQAGILRGIVREGCGTRSGCRSHEGGDRCVGERGRARRPTRAHTDASVSLLASKLSRNELTQHIKRGERYNQGRESKTGLRLSLPRFRSRPRLLDTEVFTELHDGSRRVEGGGECARRSEAVFADRPH